MVIYTVGTFDLLHVGHLALLEYCSTLGDVVAYLESQGKQVIQVLYNPRTSSSQIKLNTIAQSRRKTQTQKSVA